MALSISSRTLLEHLELPSNVIQEATRRWQRTTREIEKGLEFQGDPAGRESLQSFRDLYDRYLSVARYCDDAERLITFHSTSESKSQIELTAVDPHLLSAYAEPWKNTAHSGFRYFRGEGNTWTPEELRYPVFTYASLFQRSPAPLLDAARSELSETLAFFVRLAESSKNEKKSEIAFSVDALLDEITQEFENDPSGTRQDRVFFERLMLAGGAPKLKQRLALARLISIMKDSSFSSPELCVREAIKEKRHEEEKTAFSNLLLYVRNNPAILNSVRERLTNAYRTFRSSIDPSFAQGNTNAENERLLRGGERHDLEAILEIHVLNTCLLLARLPIQFTYVTLSLRLYDFVRQFDRSHLRVPLLHPRSAIMLHNSEIFAEHRAEMAMVVSNAIAFGHEIPKDGEINHDEMSRFEEKFGESLESTRNTFVHALADTSREREQIISSIDRIVLGEGDLTKAKWTAMRSELLHSLEKQVEDVGVQYSSLARDLADQAWSAYEEFALRDDRSRKSYVLARRFEDKSLGVDRLVLLPVGGSYRYLFSIHNQAATELFEDIPADAFKPMELKRLLKTIDDKLPSGPDDTLLGRKNTSLKHFVRSIFAASHGQWALANSLSSRAYDCFLGDDLLLEQSDEANKSAAARAIQCAVEALFVRHLARRALADSSAPGRGRNAWLKRAASDLMQGAELVRALPTELLGNKTKFDALSVRHALAAFALQIEWLSRQDLVEQAQPLDCLPPGSFNAGRKDLLWEGLCLSGECVINEPDRFRATGSFLAEKIGMVLQTVSDGVASGHSKENWRYFYARSIGLRLTLDACVLGGVLPEQYGTSDPNEKQQVYVLARDIWKEHDLWEQKLLQEAEGKIQRNKSGTSANNDPLLDREVLPARNPFAAALLSAHRASSITTYDHENEVWRVSDTAGLLSAFASMDINCNELNPFGFPRRVIRSVKERYAEALISQLHLEYLDGGSADLTAFADVALSGE